MQLMVARRQKANDIIILFQSTTSVTWDLAAGHPGRLEQSQGHGSLENSAYSKYINCDVEFCSIMIML